MKELELEFRYVVAQAGSHWGIFVDAYDRTGAKVGTRAQVMDALFSSESEAVDTLVSAMRGTMSTRKPAIKTDELDIKKLVAARPELLIDKAR